MNVIDTYFFQSEHSHHSHADHERNESRGEYDPLTDQSTTPTKEKKKVGITLDDTPPVVISSAGGAAGIISFDNPAVNFDLENEPSSQVIST